MTGNLTYDASQARLDDLHRRAARHRAATAQQRRPSFALRVPLLKRAAYRVA